MEARHVRSRILILAKHALFGSVLRDILSGDPRLQMLGQFQNLEADNLRLLRPHVIVADLDACQYDVAAAFESWRRTLPGVRICVLSTSLDVDLLHRSLNAAIDGYIVTDVPPHELKKAVNIVADGGSYVDPRVAKQALEKREDDAREAATLTIREREVLRLLAVGAANKEIASQLGIAQRTVKHHITNIFLKLNVSARAQAAVHAIKSGLVK